jgi:hypothetical protein
VEDDYNLLDNYVHSAGWITTADGNQLWATIATVDALGNELTTQRSLIDQNADRISLSINSGSGAMLYKDPTCKVGVNGTSVYTTSTTKTGYERIARTSGVPTDSNYQMKLTFTYGTTISPNLGGFGFATQSRVNAIFEAHIVAKIPVGYTINFHANSYGTGGKYEWLTSQEGTGEWATYICRIKCGVSGTFGTIAYFSIAGDKPTVRYSTNGSTWQNSYFEGAVYMQIYDADTGSWGSTINLNNTPNANKLIWYVCSATVYDIYAIEDIVSQINLTPGAVKISASKIQLEGTITANNYFRINTDGSMDVVSGTIGGFTIANGRIGASATAGGGGGGLSITEKFIRVGDSNNYALIGNDVAPTILGGAYSANGRFVNQAANGVGTTNYGLILDVTGAPKNFGINSNAPLLAPSFIGTALTLVTVSSSFSIDFSQSSIFYLYGNSAYNITMPTESQVASMFNLSNGMSTGFAFVFVFQARPGTAKLTLKNIYNHDNNLDDYPMEGGDTAIILARKYPTFGYQMLCYQTGK